MITQTQEAKIINGFMVEASRNEDFKACSFWYVGTQDEAERLAKDIKDIGEYSKITALPLRVCGLVGCHRLTEEVFCLRCSEIIADCIGDEINEEEGDEAI